AAFGPVIGPPTPSRMSAQALPLNAISAVSATADNSDFFIETLPLDGRTWMMLSCDAHPYRRKISLPIFRLIVTPIQRRTGAIICRSGLVSPAQQGGSFVKPVILCHHLVGARILE